MSKNTGDFNLSEPAPLAIGDKVEPIHVQSVFSLCIAIIKKINGALSLGDGIAGNLAGNMAAEYLDAYFPLADTPVTIRHTLGRIPIGFEVVRRDIACVIYDAAARNWTSKVLTLLSDTPAASIKIRIF